jgi:hypothetical protein
MRPWRREDATRPLSGEAGRRRATIAFDVPMESALIPEFPTAALRASAIAALLLAAAGCSVFKDNEEAQAAINQRVVGMQSGDFFDRYGRAQVRDPQSDGSIEYRWISPIGETRYSGYYGRDDRTCTLRLIAGKDGKILTATILQDMPGVTSISRCLEMFRAA